MNNQTDSKTYASMSFLSFVKSNDWIQEANKLEGIWNSNKNAWGFTLDKQNKILKIAQNIYTSETPKTVKNTQATGKTMQKLLKNCYFLMCQCFFLHSN